MVPKNVWWERWHQEYSPRLVNTYEMDRDDSGWHAVKDNLTNKTVTSSNNTLQRKSEVLKGKFCSRINNVWENCPFLGRSGPRGTSVTIIVGDSRGIYWGKKAEELGANRVFTINKNSLRETHHESTIHHDEASACLCSNGSCTIKQCGLWFLKRCMILFNMCFVAVWCRLTTQ